MNARSPLFGIAPDSGRVLAWFSCGDASAVAAKLAVEKYGPRAEVLYCDTFAYEHPDNKRFFKDVEQWLDRPIKVLRSEEYKDIYDVFVKTKWLVGVGGARCTLELKKNVRRAYQKPDDIHIFGFTAEEKKRAERFGEGSPDLFAEFPLIDANITKAHCHQRMRDAGIQLPAMYLLGYKNNNCIGCVKGQSGYWNKIRHDFPDAFDKMAKQERCLNVAINKKYVKGVRTRVFLDELPPDAGRYQSEADIECGVICVNDAADISSE